MSWAGIGGRSIWSSAVTPTARAPSAAPMQGLAISAVQAESARRRTGGDQRLARVPGHPTGAADHHVRPFVSVQVFHGHPHAVPLGGVAGKKVGERRANRVGKPAAVDIKDPYGNLMEKKGQVRDGGSFAERTGKIACWNTLMDEDRYLTRRWNEFISG